MLLICANNLR